VKERRKRICISPGRSTCSRGGWRTPDNGQNQRSTAGAPRNSLEEGKNEEAKKRRGWRHEGGEGLGFDRGLKGGRGELTHLAWACRRREGKGSTPPACSPWEKTTITRREADLGWSGLEKRVRWGCSLSLSSSKHFLILFPD
jgi:hypothetical protein